MKRSRWSVGMGAAVAGGAAIGLWLMVRATAEKPPSTNGQAGAAEPAPPALATATFAPPLLPRPHLGGRSNAVAPRPNTVAGPQVVGAGSDDPHQPGMLPHPRDEAHARLDTENRLVQRLNDAMSNHNVDEMRALIVEYRQLDPADLDASQAGYAVVADCIEHPGPASLVAAHQFYDTQGHSPLRRHIRRICFENSN